MISFTLSSLKSNWKRKRKALKKLWRKLTHKSPTKILNTRESNSIGKWNRIIINSNQENPSSLNETLPPTSTFKKWKNLRKCRPSNLWHPNFERQPRKEDVVTSRTISLQTANGKPNKQLTRINLFKFNSKLIDTKSTNQNSTISTAPVNLFRMKFKLLSKFKFKSKNKKTKKQTKK